MIDQLSQCRMSGHGQYLSPADFRSLSCANCLFFIYLITPPYTSIYRTQICADGLEICAREDPNCGDCSKKEFIFNLPDFARNRSHATDLALLQLGPPLPPAYELFTRQCCEAAWDCCTGPLQKQSRNTKCPSTWDGWQCFGEASPGEIIGRCPAYIYGDQPKQNEGKFAVKQCTENGWQTSSSTKTEWTDYRGCKVVEEEAQIKLIAGILSFSLSVLALIPALLILTCFRSVRTQSVFVIHKHLLLSFLLSGVSYLINIFLFIVDGAPGDMLHMTNHIGCRLLFAIQLRFFRLSTFSWMLAEGVYLFRLLRNAFSDDESLTPYKIICWGGPLVLTIVYSILRQVFDNEGCWISPSIHNFIEWTVMAPCLIAICTNLLLVTLILYILVKKLRYNPHLEPVQYRKAVRAALMLVPVFGLHFLLTIYRVPSQAHQILNLVLDGLQGFAVSVILCYANRSVMESVKKWISGIKESRLLKEEHKAALKRCESARSGHKKSIAEQASLTGHRGSRDEASTLTAALNGTSNGNGVTNGAGDRYDNPRRESKNARLSILIVLEMAPSLRNTFMLFVQIASQLLAVACLTIGLHIILKTKSFHVYFRSLITGFFVVMLVHSCSDTFTILIFIGYRIECLQMVYIFKTLRRWMQEVDFEVLTLTTLFLCCERVYATRQAQHYERVKHVAVVPVVGFTIVTLVVFVKFLVYYAEMEQWIHMALYCFDGVSLALLLFIFWCNRRQFERKTSKTLSHKYQLTENVRVGRIVLPLLFSTVILKIIGGTFINISKEEGDRSTRFFYEMAYRISMNLNAISAFIIIIRQHKVYFDKLKELFRRFWRKQTTEGDENNRAVVDIDGRKLNIDDAASVYFDQLDKQWAAPSRCDSSMSRRKSRLGQSSLSISRATTPQSQVRSERAGSVQSLDVISE